MCLSCRLSADIALPDHLTGFINGYQSIGLIGLCTLETPDASPTLKQDEHVKPSVANYKEIALRHIEGEACVVVFDVTVRGCSVLIQPPCRACIVPDSWMMSSSLVSCPQPPLPVSNKHFQHVMHCLSTDLS